MATIYYTSTSRDESGHEWFYINGSEGYDLTSGWTEETAKADFLSPEAEMEREIETRRAWGFYD